MPQLLLIEDDSRLGAMISEYLGKVGYSLRHVETLHAARVALARERPDLVILDLMLPDGDGLALMAELRQLPRLAGLPILMLTARGDPTDRIVGLEMGADDYVPKPFEPRELLARVRALLRRTQSTALGGMRLEVGALRLDLDARRAELHGDALDLTGHQFDLLVVLARNAGRVMSRDQIMEGLRGHSLEAFDRSIDVHVSRIRAVIEDDPREPRRLLTVRGVGYLLARTGATASP